MKLTLAIFAIFGLSTLQASAQQTPSTVTVDVGDVSCSTNAGAHLFNVLNWNFGATNPPATPGSSATAGRAQISALIVTKAFDGCSAALFTALTTGKPLSKVMLTQTDTASRQIQMTVQLGDVLVSNYQIGGAPGAEPSESISLSFSQIIITNPINGTHAGWDLKMNRSM